MAKGAKAACPICGQEVVDPDFTSNRARGTVLKCANCQANLQWVRPVWDRFHLPWLVIGMIPDAIRFLVGTPLHNSSLRRLYDISAGVALILAILMLIGFSFEKMGVLPIRLRTTDRSYEYLNSHITRLREQRAQFATAPRLQINPRSTPPSFLRRKSVLSLNDQPWIDPGSQR